VHGIKNKAEVIAIPFIVFGIGIMFYNFALTLSDPLRTDTGLLALSLGLLSVGLALIGVGMSAKSDRRYTELLERLDRNIARLPLLLEGDKLTSSQQKLAKEIIGEQSKIAAQKRLDEDTKRVGFVRGEVYQLEDGRWGIHWGGKYPL
jgi:tetrahydromethanopterin S-methyltransferase subunit G